MTTTWWKEAVIYQIYPRSFKDSDGDDIGDLKGINDQLDYLVQLGIDVLWLSPIFRSPNDDNGYDISDYRDIMVEFGTMDDFDRLLQEAHSKGLKVVLDLVVNHSSDEHLWFQESRKSADNPYADYYIWRKQKPNNWMSFFGGDAWEYDHQRDAYYLHFFTKKQPDLNWENPEVRQEIYSLMKFWLDKGVDGFRMDVIPLISKHMDFPSSNGKDFKWIVENLYANGPRLHEYLHEMNQEVSSNYDILTMGEGIGVTKENCQLYVNEDRQELNMVYHFDHMFLDSQSGDRFDITPWKLTEFKAVFREWYQALGEKGWINVFLDNHDFPRMLSRFADDHEFRKPAAKLLATLLLSHRGTPCIYQGSEIGMTNVAFPSLHDYDDVQVKNAVAEWTAMGKDLNVLLKSVHQAGRDNARTPMQWDSSEHAGFTSGTPWLPLNPNYPRINVAEDLPDQESIYKYYQRMLKIRKQHKTLVYGDYQEFMEEHPHLYVYMRQDDQGSYLVGLNFSDQTQEIQDIPDLIDAEVVIGNYPNNPQFSGSLQAWEAKIFKLS